MKFTHLNLRNYRCFEDFSIEFPTHYTDELTNEQNPINLHVLLAPNMVGKSAVLKALRIALATRFQKINANAGTLAATSISKEDHRVVGPNPLNDLAPKVEITAKATSWEWNPKKELWQEMEFEWMRHKEISKQDKGTHAKLKNIKANLPAIAFDSYARCIEKKEPESVLPVVLYVGTEYIHQPKALTDTLQTNGSVEQGYWYCLDEKSMESYVFEWFETMQRYVREQERSATAREFYGELPNLILTTFKMALQRLLPEITDLHWLPEIITKKTAKDSKTPPETKEIFHLVFTIEKEGTRTYSMLSDGYRYLVLLIGELVTRAALLNKHLGSELLAKTTGVVLIDEFGIHLHPQIQSETLARLAAIFPQVQFITSTHSPLLLNGLRKEQIHLIRHAEGNTRIVEQPETDAIGLGAEGILEELFGIDSTYDNIARSYEQRFAQLLQLKYIKGWSDAEKAEFKQLQQILARYRPDRSLSVEDPVVQLVKERLEAELTQQANHQPEDLDSLRTRVNAILDNLFDKQKGR